MLSMPEAIRIVTVERDGEDGLIVTLSDGTTAGYIVEELLELTPCREPINTNGSQCGLVGCRLR